MEITRPVREQNYTHVVNQAIVLRNSKVKIVSIKMKINGHNGAPEIRR